MLATILTIEIVSLAVLALLYWRAPHGFEDAQGFHALPHPTAGDCGPDARCPSCVGAASVDLNSLHDTRGDRAERFCVVGSVPFHASELRQ